MSVSDPLLKEIKGHVLTFAQGAKDGDVEDQHSSLRPFCETLEAIFQRGLKNVPGLFGSSKRDYWSWMEALPSSPAGNNEFYRIHINLIQFIKENSKVKTNLGRGRLYIRNMLMHKGLTAAVESLVAIPAFLQKMYDSESILGDSIKSEIFSTYLKLVQEVNFKLVLKNASFLDDTWVMPVYKIHEFLPCEHLGVKICFVQERVVVANVEDGSPAMKDGVLEPGDVIDEVSGEALAQCNRHRAHTLLRRVNSQPIIMGIVKRNLPGGAIYPPLVGLLREVIITESPISISTSTKDSQSTEVKSTPDINLAGLTVFYLGSAYVGEVGTMEVIDKGLEDIIQSQRERMEVLIQFTETHVVVTHVADKKIILKNSFTEVASCGRRVNFKKQFAFVTGETSCNLSKHFDCHGFEAIDEEQSKDILQSIAQGFKRTKWAV